MSGSDDHASALSLKTETFAFVGSQTSGKGEGISMLPYNERTGDFGARTLLRDTENPTFLEVDAVRSMLYAVQESDRYNGISGGGLAAYSLNFGRDGLPRPVGLAVRRSGGTYPCHVALEPKGRTLFVSNYGDGVLSVFPLGEKGEPGPSIQEIQYKGRGPNATRQECAHVHSVSISPDGRFALAADLGRDVIILYPIAEATGALVPEARVELSVSPGSGPRHFAFHPQGSLLFLVEELSSEITVFVWDGQAGKLRNIQTISTLPEGFKGENLAADVHLTPDGRYLYCSNRGHDSIARFRVNKASGTVEALGHTPCGGSWPRNFALDPKGLFLFVANSKSDSITRFRIDAGSGDLHPAGEPLRIGEPMCIRFYRLFPVPPSIPTP